VPAWVKIVSIASLFKLNAYLICLNISLLFNFNSTLFFVPVFVHCKLNCLIFNNYYQNRVIFSVSSWCATIQTTPKAYKVPLLLMINEILESSNTAIVELTITSLATRSYFILMALARYLHKPLDI
jgi:hypothetical protein